MTWPLRDRKDTTLRALITVALAGMIAALACASATASTLNPRGHFLGQLRPPTSPGGGLHAADAAGAVSFHGGSVMHSNTVHVVYWGPPGAFPHRYEAVVNAYFANVAADSGTRSNVYSTAAEYGDAGGPAAYQSSFAGAIEDTNPYPDSGCRYNTSICLTGDQLEHELGALVAARNLPRGLSDVYIVMTPPRVGVCEQGDGRVCSNRDFCAYHSDLLLDDQEVLYVAVPAPTICESGQEPNASLADGALDSLSHEHIETITDPLGDGWFDGAGDEIGDICDNRYGPSLGSNANGLYNQLIGDGDYYLQLEWSNAAGACIAREGSPARRSGTVSASVGHGSAVHDLHVSPGAVARGAVAGATIGFSLAAPARVSVTIGRRARIGGRRCRRAHRHGRRCRRYVRVSRRVAGNVPAGSQRLSLLALVGRRSLAPGSYRVSVAVHAPGERSRRAVATFTVR